jgi:dihydrofolate synthase / folylpolyglutamate synthase
MHNQLAEVQDLDSWLTYISSIHPREIELGLDRIRTVADNMGLTRPAKQVVVVAGTNGKGSCVSSMERILVESEFSVASYTSPHLISYTERIRVNAEKIDEASVCAAFSHIEASRDGVSLSYFEFSTLAALWIFCQAEIDVALLEVGLGGRLDAVNIIDADVAIISSIALDHQDWLGDSLDSIGREKSGILRSGVPLVYGDSEPVGSIIQRSEELEAQVYLINEHFRWQESSESGQWQWRGGNEHDELLLDELPIPHIHLNNASIALQALSLLDLELSRTNIQRALKNLHFQGRQERRIDKKAEVDVILDVAHNAAAARLLAVTLAEEKAQNPQLAQISVVIAVMADKDIEGIALALESCVDIWYISQVEEPRCMPAAEATGRLERSGYLRQQFSSDSVINAYKQACKDSQVFAHENPGQNSLVVVIGSFFTVAAVRDLSKTAG